jgi:hypothetical protein
MWVSVIVAALAAAPPPHLAIIPVVRPSLIDPATAAQVEVQLRKALEKEVAVQPLAETFAAIGHAREITKCENNRACFSALGKLARAWAAVRVDAVEVAGSLTIQVQVVDSETGDEVAEEHFTVQGTGDEEIGRRFIALAAKLKAKVPAPKPEDAPVAKAPHLVPEAKPEVPVVEQAPRARRGPVPPVLTGVAALAFAGAAAGFFAMGLDAQTCLQGAPVNGSRTVCVPQNQVQAKQAQADTGLVVGSVASAFAVGLAVTAIVLFVTD